MNEFDYGDDWETPGNGDDTTPGDGTPESELPLPDALPPESIQEALEAPTVVHVVSDDGEGNVDVVEGGAATPAGVEPVWAPVETHLAAERWDTSAASAERLAGTDWARNENGGGGITGPQGSSDA